MSKHRALQDMLNLHDFPRERHQAAYSSCSRLVGSLKVFAVFELGVIHSLTVMLRSQGGGGTLRALY